MATTRVQSLQDLAARRLPQPVRMVWRHSMAHAPTFTAAVESAACNVRIEGRLTSPMHGLRLCSLAPPTFNHSNGWCVLRWDSAEHPDFWLEVHLQLGSKVRRGQTTRACPALAQNVCMMGRHIPRDACVQHFQQGKHSTTFRWDSVHDPGFWVAVTVTDSSGRSAQRRRAACPYTL